jgi:L-lactate dehydrogenase
MIKTVIIGGGGRVGSNAAFALQLGGIVREIVLLDANQELAEGEALDLMHGAPLVADQFIRAGGYDEVASADCVIITAGSRRKPDESRLDLINRNVSIFKGILNDARKVGIKPGALVLVVSNPVDLLTRLAVETLCPPHPWQLVIGLGTVLDSIRFQALIAEKAKLPATQVKALMLGEHGDSMVAAWSAAQCGGMPLASLPGFSDADRQALEKRARTSGAEVIRRKGGAGYAVGVAIAEVVHSFALDRKRLLPVSSKQQGVFGVKNVCYSIPSVVGRKGVEAQIAMELWPREQSGLVRSGEVLDAAYREMMASAK